MASNVDDTESSEARVLERVAAALRELRFGSLEIVVHDSRVVRITRTEKVRLEDREEGR